MKKVATVLIIVSMLVIGYFTLSAPEPAAPPPVADLATLRNTTAGDVVGFIDLEGARAWKGIPYAEPPAGNLRWRAPQPPEPWTGTQEALAAGDMCPQMKSLLSGSLGDPDSAIAGFEDCLYLNVGHIQLLQQAEHVLHIGHGGLIGHHAVVVGAPTAALVY